MSGCEHMMFMFMCSGYVLDRSGGYTSLGALTPYESSCTRYLVFLILKIFQSLHLYHMKHGENLPDLHPDLKVHFKLLFFKSLISSLLRFHRSLTIDLQIK